MIPWRNTTQPPAEQFVFERNPYFHRVDENGLQLPYIDKFVLNVSSSSIIPAKTGSGESELQAVGIDFADYAFLKDAEKRYPVKVESVEKDAGVGAWPCFRISTPPTTCGGRCCAMSACVGRSRLRSTGKRSTRPCSTALPRKARTRSCPKARCSGQSSQKRGPRHDTAQANALLDEAGLNTRDDDGIRVLPDGRSAQIVVETAGESTIETDALELVTDHWRDVGVALFIRTSQRDVFRSRAMGGQIMMSMWSGIDNGVPTANMNPGQLAPTADDQLQWPVWGAYYVSQGKMGTAPDLPEAAELISLLQRWRQSAELSGRTEVVARHAGALHETRSSRSASSTPPCSRYCPPPRCGTCLMAGSGGSTRLPTLASTCLTRSGWREIPERAAVYHLAHCRHDPNAADHISIGFHDH